MKIKTIKCSLLNWKYTLANIIAQGVSKLFTLIPYEQEDLTIPLLTQSARSTKSSTTLRRRWGRICRHTRTYAHAFPARDSAQWSQCAESAHGAKRWDSGGSCQTRYHVYQRQLENTQVTTGQHFTSSGKPSILANVQLMLLVQINKNIKLCVTGFIFVCIKVGLPMFELLEKSLIFYFSYLGYAFS